MFEINLNEVKRVINQSYRYNLNRDIYSRKKNVKFE